MLRNDVLKSVSEVVSGEQFMLLADSVASAILTPLANQFLLTTAQNQR